MKHYRSVFGVRNIRGKTSYGFFGAQGVGWGYFDYEIRIEFAKELNIRPLVFVPELCFENGGITHSVEIDLTAEQAFLMGLFDKAKFLQHKSLVAESAQ